MGKTVNWKEKVGGGIDRSIGLLVDSICSIDKTALLLKLLYLYLNCIIIVYYINV